MKSTSFKIQGEYSEDDNAFLYWSNIDGWVDFGSATEFFESELKTGNPPMEATHIVWIDENGEIVNAVDVKTAFYG